MARNRTYSEFAETTYDTPLVDITRAVGTEENHARVLLKLEFFNPLSSVKDRIGRAMIEEAERAGTLRKQTHIIEPTSGNTGIALAFLSASRGYRLTLTMPETMSQERRSLLRALGAHLVLTPAEQGMKGAIAKASELVAADPDAWSPSQFDNPANPAIHEASTGPEIWADSKGGVDAIVAGVGTGGTITGVTRYLRRHKPSLKAYALEPVESPVIAGGKPGPHRIQGIGAGFVPRNLDITLLDGIEHVTSEEAFAAARQLAKATGILGGISTGANVAAAVRLAKRSENRGKTIVTFACSAGERYLSTPLYPSGEVESGGNGLIQRLAQAAYTI